MTDGTRTQLSHNPVDEQNRNASDQERDRRRDYRRDDQIAEETVAVDSGEPLRGDHRPDEAADQGVR